MRPVDMSTSSVGRQRQQISAEKVHSSMSALSRLTPCRPPNHFPMPWPLCLSHAAPNPNPQSHQPHGCCSCCRLSPVSELTSLILPPQCLAVVHRQPCTSDCTHAHLICAVQSSLPSPLQEHPGMRLFSASYTDTSLLWTGVASDKGG